MMDHQDSAELDAAVERLIRRYIDDLQAILACRSQWPHVRGSLIELEAWSGPLSRLRQRLTAWRDVGR